MPYIYPPSSFLPTVATATTTIMSQTMLLTKSLSTFLAAHSTPQLHTLLLLSPTGKLLSSSSPSTASTLRTQATLACSLWNLYNPFQSIVSSLVVASLPSSNSIHHQSTADQDLNSITIQLEFGTMCIRALSSGLLFVAIGPSSSSALAVQPPYPTSHLLPQHPTQSPPASPNAQLEREHGSQLSLQGDVLSGAVSDAGSVGTQGSVAGATIWAVRRQAEEVGNYLEGALDGFVLSGGER